MTGLWVTGLLVLSVLLLLSPSRTPPKPGPLPGRPVPGAGQAANRSLRRPFLRRLVSNSLRSPKDPSLQEVPLLIHQLTGLLAAGRAPHQLWADAAALQAATGKDPAGSLSARMLPVLEAAAQSASLGLSPVPVFRAAAEEQAGTPGKMRRRGGDRAAVSPAGLWTGLAACVSVSERSGAPLAGVLSRYAAQLESAMDNQAARETAMAGPQATVRLLTWLPVGGLGLGYLLGADPVGILLGSPLGWLAGTAGVALSLAGRFWSRALVRQAAGV